MEDEIKSVEEVKPVEEVTTTKMVDDAVRENDRTEKLVAELKAANAETAKLQARAALGGRAEAGIPTPVAPPITDAEYADKVEKGEVNPFAEDGLN